MIDFITVLGIIFMTLLLVFGLYLLLYAIGFVLVELFKCLVCGNHKDPQ